MSSADGASSGGRFSGSAAGVSIGRVTRRGLLASAALLVITGSATARVVSKVLPWSPNEAYPVAPVTPGGYLFFTVDEAKVVDAIVDRLIPTDDLGPGAKDAGVTVFI